MANIAIKSIRKTIRFTPEEYEIVKMKAKKSNFNISQYLSFSALEKDIVIFSELKEFTHQLSKVGTNLNQIAILAHQGKVSCIDIDMTKKVVCDIWQSLTSLTQQTKRTRA